MTPAAADAKNPMRPPRPLVAEEGDFLSFGEALWRIHRTRGRHRQRWNDLREFGPISTMRWDPHPSPQGVYPGAAVSYASPNVATAFAEAFQHRRAITLSSAQALVGWMPSRELRMLDLTGQWLLHNGASSSLAGGRKDRCRAWSHAIGQTWPDLDGLYVPSTMTNAPMVVLYAPSRSAFPAGPNVARSLDSPSLSGVLVDVAASLRWPIRQ